MFKSNNSIKSEKLVFYVDDDADDFTFYLERDNKNTVVKTLLRDRLKDVESQKAKTVEDETFTLSEEVSVTSLWLTKDSLKRDEHSFWENLKKPTHDSPHNYLKQQLESKAQPRKNLELKKALEVLQNGNLDDQTKKTLLQALAEVLNDAIKGDSLASSPWVNKKLPEREKTLIKTLPDKIKTKWRNRVLLQGTCSDLIKETQTGRGLICFSYVGKCLSITFRRLTAGEGYEAEKGTDRHKRLFSLAEYSNVIHKQVFDTDSQHAHGLLVVTGSTKSAKSEIARAIIHKYLTSIRNGKRTPHLVTFEDPVERFYSYQRSQGSQGSDPWKAIERSESVVIDYTPRQKGKDVALLRDALTDALRQTPAAFFVGETRDKQEWELLLDFAATGHLIVTTAHANSLVEAMHKIFEARGVKTPADRGEIANKLFGLIHLRMGKIVINEKSDTTEVLFPALWRRTGRGVAALTSDGLASLLPHRSTENENNEGPSSLGRRWLVECLIKSAEDDLTKTFDRNPYEPFGESQQSLSTRAYKRATEWDLEGV